MINTTTPNLEQITARIAQSDPSNYVGEINVQGNVTGNIVVGNRNVIGDNNVIYEIDTFNGTLVNWHAAPPISRRGVSQPPPQPRAFVGRAQELEVLEQHIQNNEAVLLHGHSGMGKTTLAQRFANSDVAKKMQDGVFYVEQPQDGNILGLQDVLQRLFDKLFESNPPTKLTDSIVEANLASTSPLVIIDEMGLSQDALNRLRSVFSSGAVLATSPIAPFDDVFLSIEVTALSHEEAIQLFIEKSGIVADATSHQVVDQICRQLEDIPLAIATIANAIRQKRLQLDTVLGGLTKIDPPSQDHVQAAIERSFGLLYSNLNKQERDMLATVAAAPGKSVDREWLESLAGGAITSQALESLEVLYANSPRLRLPDGIRRVLQSGRTDLGARREQLLGHLLDELRSKSLDFNFVGDELGNILGLLDWSVSQQRWSDVVVLGRAVDPYLTLWGLWDAWETVLKQIQVAARNLGDSTVRAWALHQLGTREIGVGSRRQAIDLLRRALEIRLLNRDFVGVAYTLHNLRILLPPGSSEGPKDPNDPNGPARTFGSEVQIPPTGRQIWEAPDQFSWKKFWVFLRRSGGWIAGTLLGLAVVAVVLTQPYLKLTLQAAPMKYNLSGQEIEYTYVVNNVGFVPVPGPIFVSDDKTRVRCPALKDIGDGNNSLDWNESMTCMGFYSITETDIQKGSVTETAIARAIDEKKKTRVQSSPQSLTVPYDNNYLALDVQAQPPTYGISGQTITIAYIVSNIGASSLGGPINVITDDKLPVNCPDLIQIGDSDGLLGEGESVTCTATYQVTDADVKNGWVTNTARARAGKIDSEARSITLYGIPQSGLTLAASADRQTYKAVGEQVTYTYTVTNQGKTPINGPVRITSDLMDVVPCPEVAEVGNRDNLLDPGEVLTCPATHVIDQPDIDRGSVTENATASAGGATTDVQSVTIFFELPPPTLFKSADREKYRAVGEQVTYKYVVMNQGSVSASDPVIVKDDMVDVQCPAFKPASNQKVLLAPSQSVTCWGTYTITDADVKQGSVTNTAVAYIGNKSSPPESFTIYFDPVIGTSHLSLHKRAKPGTYDEAGQRIHYIYYITNDGKYPLEGPLSVKDDKTDVTCPEINTTGDGDDVLDPGEYLVCNAVYTITDRDMENGSVTNSARASMKDVESNADAVTVNEMRLDLLVTTTLTPSAEIYNKAGDTIQYAYGVTGKSKQPLNGPLMITVDNDKMSIECPAINTVGNGDSFLDWNEAITCTSKYSVTQADIDIAQPNSKQGAVITTSSATMGWIRSNEYTVTVMGPEQRQAILFDKAADLTNFDSVDQKITYSYKITNSGNVTLFSPFQVSDDRVNNGVTFPCGLDQQYAPLASATCTASYTITQADFETRAVTNTATASLVNGDKTVTATATTTITCEYKKDWFAYTVDPNESLEHIVTWYSDKTQADLQKANCMGSSTAVTLGQTLYVPSPPPLATISGSIRDTSGQPLVDTPVTLVNVATGSSLTIYTGARGEFIFSGLVPGKYKIFQVEITVRRGDRIDQPFTIIPG